MSLYQFKIIIFNPCRVYKKRRYFRKRKGKYKKQNTLIDDFFRARANLAETDTSMSLGVNFVTTNINLASGDSVKLQLWDIDASTRFTSMRKSYSLGTSGVVLVINPSKPEKFESIRKFYDETNEQYKNFPHSKFKAIPFVIIVENPEQKEWNVEEYKEFARTHNGIYLEIDPQNILEVDNAFITLVEFIFFGVFIKLEEFSVLRELKQITGKSLTEIPEKEALKSGFRTENQHIVELGLENANLSRLPNTFGNLNLLTKLNLSNNEFKRIPPEIWPLKHLETLNLNGNPLEKKSKDIAEGSIKEILDYCKKQASINLFASHAFADFERYNINKIAECLEKRPEINKVIYYEKDLVGSIKNFMRYQIPKCQVLIFVATSNALKSKACSFEIQTAIDYAIEIVPVLGDLTWKKLKKHGLNDNFGIEYNYEDLNAFCKELYDYIMKLRYEIDIFDKVGESIDKILEEFGVFLKTEQSKQIIEKNLKEINQLFDNVKQGRISNEEFIENLLNFLLNQMSSLK